jgi:hypothetical protein
MFQGCARAVALFNGGQEVADPILRVNQAGIQQDLDLRMLFHPGEGLFKQFPGLITFKGSMELSEVASQF